MEDLLTKGVLTKVSEDMHTRLRLLALKRKTTLQGIGIAALQEYLERCESEIEMVQAS